MSRKSNDRRWESKFAKFVQEYGVERLAKRLEIAPSAVYHWMSGRTSPRPAKAMAIQRIAKRSGRSLSLEEIFQHFRGGRSESFRSAASVR